MKTAVYIINSNKQIEQIDDSIMIVDEKEENVFVLGSFEVYLLRLFNGKNSVEKISFDLKEHFGASYRENEFLEFVEQLIEKELLILK